LFSSFLFATLPEVFPPYELSLVESRCGAVV
jgi:hypothetical protein